MAFISNSQARGDVIDVNPEVQLDNFSLHDLLRLKADVERRLPARSIKDINLSSELVLQFLAAQELQNQVLKDDVTPANQKAQTLGATAAVLGQISKMQSEIYSTERLKVIESKLIEALNQLPADLQQQFLSVYEACLDDSRT
jgi:hypothetical protein